MSLLAGWPPDDATGIAGVQREIRLWDELMGDGFWGEFGLKLEAERDAGLPFGHGRTVV